MNEFKVGDKVECLLFGVGVIDAITDNKDFPIGVSFGQPKIQWYTYDGRFRKDTAVCLTKGTWKIDEIPTEVTYKKGELVWANLSTHWDVYRYLGKAYSDDLHFLGSLAAEVDRGKPMNVSFCNEVDSKNIRKFKDTPYDIND